MTAAMLWTPAYLAEVADHILWNYQPLWDRIREADPKISEARLRQLMPLVRGGRATESDIAELHREVQRFRDAGARLFTTPFAIPDLIFCTCAFPLPWRGIPRPDEIAPDRVELLHMGDMPANTPDWRDRANIAGFPNLLSLTMFHSGLAEQPLGIDLAALTKLRALDLRENRLRDLPTEVLACAAVEYLDLRDNPLKDVSTLSGLRALRWLGLARTSVGAGDVKALRQQLPNCEIAAGS